LANASSLTDFSAASFKLQKSTDNPTISYRQAD